MPQKSNKPLHLLSGTPIKTEKGTFYIKNGVRMIVPTRRVAKSWRFRKIIKTTEEAVSHYPIVGKLGFRDGTLLYCIADHNYYIVSNNKLVHVESPDVITDHGLNWVKDAVWISKAERDLHGRAS